MNKKIYLLIFFMFIFSLYFYFQNKYDFNLISEFKNETTLKDFKNNKLIVYFGYTYCPDVCPNTLYILSNILNDINNSNIKLIFISLDPKRDNNITKTNQYLRYFYKNSDALLAKNNKDLELIAKNYGVIYKRVDLNNSAMKYSISHSNQLYFIDKNGKFVIKVTNLYPEELKEEIKYFINN